MPASIKIDQAAKPAGVAGQAREDLSTGTAVQATAMGGPFLAHQWSFVHRPIDIMTATRASSIFSAPTGATTLVDPINVAGTYELELRVDSGSGLGATAADIARITFYAGPALATLPNRLPRRKPAFSETTEHNVPDAVDPSGNPEGWSREMYRWFAVIEKLYEGHIWAAGRIALPLGGPISIVRGFNIAGTSARLSTGRVRIDFATALPDANYNVITNARGAIGGSATPNTELAASFIVERADLGGALADADFNFVVLQAA